MTSRTPFEQSYALLEQVEQALQTLDYSQLANLVALYSQVNPSLANADEKSRLLTKHEDVAAQLTAVREQVLQSINQSNSMKLGYSYQAV